MLVPEARAPIIIYWEDREGNVSAQRQYHDHDTPLAQIEAGIGAWIGLCQPLSDAVVTRYTILWQWQDTDTWIHSDTSDVYRYGSIFYRNNSVVERVLVPSFKPHLLQMAGNYAGVRIDHKRPEVANLLAALAPMLEFICTPEGESFPLEYLIGGLVL